MIEINDLWHVTVESRLSLSSNLQSLSVLHIHVYWYAVCTDVLTLEIPRYLPAATKFRLTVANWRLGASSHSSSSGFLTGSTSNGKVVFVTKSMNNSWICLDDPCHNNLLFQPTLKSRSFELRKTSSLVTRHH
jgi:hypothetical protein